MSAFVESIKKIEKEYQAAIKQLHDGKIKEARKEFEKLAGKDDLEESVADRIATYISICDTRMQTVSKAPETEEEYLTEAAFHINAHQLEGAFAVLKAAEKAGVESDSLHYLRAQAHALDGAWDDVMKSLNEAVRLRPDNRILASNDFIISAGKKEHDELAEFLNVGDDEEE